MVKSLTPNRSKRPGIGAYTEYQGLGAITDARHSRAVHSSIACLRRGLVIREERGDPDAAALGLDSWRWHPIQWFETNRECSS
ncbi:hypothetical protein EMIT0324P_110023 [Pseudomonas chlororaphis]